MGGHWVAVGWGGVGGRVGWMGVCGRWVWMVVCVLWCESAVMKHFGQLPHVHSDSASIAQW